LIVLTNFNNVYPMLCT